MLEQLRREIRIGKVNQNDLKTGFTRLLHGRNAICILSNEDESIYSVVRRVGRDIEPDAHVYAFLFEIGLEVLIGDGAGTGIQGDVLWCPTAKFENASSNRTEVSPREIAEPLIGSRKIMPFARYWQSGSTFVHCTIVVENPEDILAGRLASVCDLLDVVGIILATALLGENPEIAAVDQNSDLDHGGSEKKTPAYLKRGSQNTCPPTGVADK